MGKKLICLNLALVLLLSLMPAGVLASDSNDGETVSPRIERDMRYVTFYKNDGSGENMEIVIRQSVSNGQLWWPSLSNYWYEFESAYQIGWNTEADGSGEDIALPEQLSSNENNPTQLYAKIIHVATPATLFLLPTVDGEDYLVLEKDDLSDHGLFTLPESSVFLTDEPITGWGVYSNYGEDYLPGETFDPYADLYRAYPRYGEYITIYYKDRSYDEEQNLSKSYYFFEESGFPYISDRVYNHPEPDEILVGFNSQQDGTGVWIMETDAADSLPNEIYAIYEIIPESGNYVIIESENGFIIDGKKLTSHVMTYGEGGTVTLPVSLADGTPVTLWSDGSAQYPSGVPVTVTSDRTLRPYVTLDEDNTGIIYGDGGKTESGSEYLYVWAISSWGSLVDPQFRYFYKDGAAMVGYESEDGTEYSLNLRAEDVVSECEENGAPAKFNVQYNEVNAPFIQYIGRGGITASGEAYVIDDDAMSDSVFTVQENMFTVPDGAVFLGWMDSDDDYGATFYDAGDTIDLNGRDHIALQACWSTTYQTHRVTYHYTDREGEEQEETLLSSRVSPPNSASSKPSSWGNWGEDYLIAGWNTEPDGSGEWYREYDEFDLSGERVINLYEQAIRLDQITGEYCILDYNSAGNPYYAVAMIENGTVTLPESDFGWWEPTMQTVATIGYIDELIPQLINGTIDAVNGMTFYEQVPDTTTLHENLGNNSEERTLYMFITTSNAEIQLPDANTTFDIEDSSIEFAGWNEKSDGSGRNMTSLFVPWLSNPPANLYAQWKDAYRPIAIPVTRPNDGPSTDDSDGWNDIQNEVSDAIAGDAIDVDMNGETEVPSEIFNEIAGKNVTISFNMGDGISWTIDGQDIPQDEAPEETDLGISMDTHGIPVDVVNTVAGDLESVQFTLSHDGPFGFDMTLTVPLGNANSGFWANLYYYVDGDLEFQTASRIREDGSAALRMTHASQYAIVIDTVSHAVPFEDVRASDWFYDAVSYVYANDLMDGVGDGLFDPDGEVTRAQLVTILWRLDGEPVVNYLMPFDDVASGEWYTEAVRWAAGEGIVNGVSETEFAPNSAVTREQFAAILYRYAVYKGHDVSIGEDTNILSYADFAEISEYAISAMQWACGEGIITGVTASELAPQGTATRAQAAAMLMRFVEA